MYAVKSLQAFPFFERNGLPAREFYRFSGGQFDLKFAVEIRMNFLDVFGVYKLTPVGPEKGIWVQFFLQLVQGTFDHGFFMAKMEAGLIVHGFD